MFVSYKWKVTGLSFSKKDRQVYLKSKITNLYPVCDLKQGDCKSCYLDCKLIFLLLPQQESTPYSPSSLWLHHAATLNVFFLKTHTHTLTHTIQSEGVTFKSSRTQETTRCKIPAFQAALGKLIGRPNVSHKVINWIAKCCGFRESFENR